MLNELAEQLKGQIYDELNEEKYRLTVMTKFATSDYEIKKFAMPNPKSALLVMGVLTYYFKICKNDIEIYTFGFEKWNKDHQEWEDWEDLNGYTLAEYTLDENFTMLPPFNADDLYY